METGLWVRFCKFRQLYLFFVAICGGLLLLMVITFPAQPSGSHESAITVVNIIILTIGTVSGLVLYWYCSTKAKKQLETFE